MHAIRDENGCKMQNNPWLIMMFVEEGKGYESTYTPITLRKRKKNYIAWRSCIVALCPIAHCVQWALSRHASYRMCHSCRQVWLGDSIGCHLNAAMLCWSATSGHVTFTLISEAMRPQCPIPSPANIGHCWLPPCSHIFIIIILFFYFCHKIV